MGRARAARASIRELKKNIEVSESRKEELTKYLQELWERYEKGLISPNFYVETAHKHFDGKTLKQWIEHYEHYIKECKKLIRKHRRKLAKKTFSIVLFSVILISLLGFLITNTQLQSQLTGLLIQEPIEVPEIISEAEATITTTQQQATLGQPVKWTKQISLDKQGTATIRLPIEAENVNVKNTKTKNFFQVYKPSEEFNRDIYKAMLSAAKE